MSIVDDIAGAEDELRYLPPGEYDVTVTQIKMGTAPSSGLEFVAAEVKVDQVIESDGPVAPGHVYSTWHDFRYPDKARKAIKSMVATMLSAKTGEAVLSPSKAQVKSVLKEEQKAIGAKVRVSGFSKANSKFVRYSYSLI